MHYATTQQNGLTLKFLNNQPNQIKLPPNFSKIYKTLTPLQFFKIVMRAVNNNNLTPAFYASNKRYGFSNMVKSVCYGNKPPLTLILNACAKLQQKPFKKVLFLLTYPHTSNNHGLISVTSYWQLWVALNYKTL